MALQGGIGILKSDFPTPAQQAVEVSKVKKYKNSFIPKYVRIDDSVLELFKDKSFKAALVTDNGNFDGKLLGVFSKNLQ